MQYNTHRAIHGIFNVNRYFENKFQLLVSLSQIVFSYQICAKYYRNIRYHAPNILRGFGGSNCIIDTLNSLGTIPRYWVEKSTRSLKRFPYKNWARAASLYSKYASDEFCMRYALLFHFYFTSKKAMFLLLDSCTARFMTLKAIVILYCKDSCDG